MSVFINNYINGFSNTFSIQKGWQPWQITNDLQKILTDLISTLDDNYRIDNGIAIHKTAVIESGVILKAPVIICEHCFVGAHAYLRGGVFLAGDVSIGPGCEIKSSIIFSKTSAAHFNFIGDSIIGSNVNFEAGSLIANHFNERDDKTIRVVVEGVTINTGVEKFGALVGDNSKIGANAVLSPGTLLPPGTVVKRLELIDQFDSK